MKSQDAQTRSEPAERSVLLKIGHDIQSVQGILSSIQSVLDLSGDAHECFEGAYQKLDKIREFAVLKADGLRAKPRGA